MKNKLFIAWYYSHGLVSFLKVWKDFLVFAWNYFSVAEMARTLVSPWKRDVSVRDWVGFSLSKSSQRIMGNFVSRTVGLFVRTGVIIIGLIAWLAVLFFGGIMLFCYLALPLVFILSIFFLITAKIAVSVLSAVFIAAASFLLVASYFSYRNQRKEPYEEMALDKISKEKWFERVCLRLGKTKEFIHEKIFENFAEFRLLLEADGLTEEDFNRLLAWEISVERKRKNKKKFWRKENLGKIKPIGRGWKYAYTNTLDRFSIDLTSWDPTEYRDAEIIGRKNEFEVLKLVLRRPEQNNVILVGNPGIGRKSIVHHLVRLIRKRKLDGFFNDRRIIQLDISLAIAHASKNGDNMEHFLHRLFQEAVYAGNIILYIEGIENFLGNEKSQYRPDISSIIEEYLDVPAFQIIATSTLKEFHRLIERHENLIKYFESIELTELTEEESIEVLFKKYEQLEEKFPVFTYSALKEIIKDSGKYFGAAPLPERALDLAEEVLLYWEQNNQRMITAETVNDFVSLKTGAHFGKIGKEEREKLLNLETVLHQRVISQDEAVDQIAQAVRKMRSGIGNPQKPAGSFLFLGPTGVGKTETAKALAEAHFGDENKMIRLDMSEYQSPYSLERLIGSEKNGEPGQLTSKVKDNPFALLLLDEIEKAYPRVLDVFLQILDEGFVTDASGERINFRNMIIIATSNAGSFLIKKMTEEGKSEKEIKEALVNFITENNIFRLEFLNRFDNIIFFRTLAGRELATVAQLVLSRFSKKLKKEKNIKVTFAPGVVEKIIEIGYNPVFGARSINRFVDDRIEDAVVRKIIGGELKNGAQTEITVADIIN